MGQTSITVQGTLDADGTLRLDEKPNLPPGRVTVVLRHVPQIVSPPTESLLDFIQRARRELEASGSRFMNEEEVTAWIEELRADDDRLEKTYQEAVETPQPKE